MTTDSSGALLDVSSCYVTPNAPDCSNDPAPADLSATAPDTAQSEQQCNAWLAMLRWFELPQPMH